MSLKQKVLTSTKWVAIANIIRQILQLISLIIFARLLSPDDFGIFSILMIFVGFMQMFTDMGTGAALIHIKNPSENLLSSIFYFNILIGIFLTIILILLAQPIAIFFKIPEIKILIEMISISFIIASFGVVQKAIYEKYLNFKVITMIESFAAFSSLSIGLIAAYYGFGVFSLILQTLSASLILVILLWMYSDWRPIRHFSIDDIKSIWKYSANLSSFNIINYFARNADNFLIGKFLNSYALGVYSLAYKIMLYPLQNISRVVLRILFPAFAQIQEDNEKFQNVYLRIIFFIALITFPLMFGLMSTANVLVPIVFGEKWKELAILLIILAPVGMIQSIVTTTGSLYMAKGNNHTLLRIGVISSIVTVIFFMIGIPFGVIGVAIFYALSNIIMLYPVLKLAWKQIDLSISRGLFELYPIFLSSLIMASCVVFLGKIFASYSSNTIVQLIFMILSGITIYYFLIRLRYGNIRTILRELKQ